MGGLTGSLYQNPNGLNFAPAGAAAGAGFLGIIDLFFNSKHFSRKTNMLLGAFEGALGGGAAADAYIFNQQWMYKTAPTPPNSTIYIGAGVGALSTGLIGAILPHNDHGTSHHIARVRTSGQPKEATNAFFGTKAAAPNDPSVPKGSAPSVPAAGTDTDPMHQLKVVNENSNVNDKSNNAKGANSDDEAKRLSGVGFDTSGAGPGKDVDPVGTPHAEPVLTEEQNRQLKDRLEHNQDFQRLQVEHEQAAKDAAKAKQALDAATAKYNAMPDSPAKQQAQVDLANARDASTRAENAVAANEKNQDIIKAAEYNVIVLPAKPKPKPVEPPVPGGTPPAGSPPDAN